MTSARPRYWVHALLLCATLFTTTLMGAWMAFDFHNNLPPFSGGDLEALGRFFRDPGLLAGGLPFSLTLLAILLAHEFGHYLACVFYRVDASLPYFLPAPTPIGTLGAFIRIRSPIFTMRELFDIGIAGPLAGALFLLPAFAIGLAYSKVLPGIGEESELIFGAPLIQRLLMAAVFPGAPSEDVYLHPVARAAWVGALATALNLLPIGQLDGGHILYSFVGRWHRRLSQLFVALLVPLAYFSLSWLVWAILLFFFGLRHPAIYDSSGLSRGRKWLGLLALSLFILCFTLTPLRIEAAR